MAVDDKDKNEFVQIISSRVDREPEENTARFMIRDAKAKLAHVGQIISKNPSTQNNPAIETQGPWTMGHLYGTNEFEVKLLSCPKGSSSLPIIEFRNFNKVVYVGVIGQATIHLNQGYMKIFSGSVVTVDPNMVHGIEPGSDETVQILQINLN